MSTNLYMYPKIKQNGDPLDDHENYRKAAGKS